MSSTEHIKKLVYSGKVLDEHGGWIPLSEKLQKELTFLGHLEKGEVLLNSKWVAISEAQRTQPPTTVHSLENNENEIDDETTITPVPIQTPEETVSFSTETIYDLANVSAPDNAEPDFPPETTTLKIEVPDTTIPPSLKNQSTQHNSLISGETQLDLSTATPSVKDARTQKIGSETEFDETVMYNINVLKQSIDQYKNNQDTKKPTQQPNISDDWELTRPKRPIFLVVSASVIIIVLVLTVLKILL